MRGGGDDGGEGEGHRRGDVLGGRSVVIRQMIASQY